MRMKIIISSLSLAVLASACASPYTVRNVGKGKTALNVSFGGPLLDNLGPAIPLPAVVVGAQHGLTEAWDIHYNLHVLPAVFGNMGIDFGTTRRLVKQRGGIPEWTASLRLSLLTNFKVARLYPELETYVSWLVKKRWLLYVGLTSLWDFFVVNDSHFRAVWGPVLGAEVRFKGKYALGLSFRWLSPERRTKDLVAGWVAPGGQGLFLIQLGFRVNFGSWGPASPKKGGAS